MANAYRQRTWYNNIIIILQCPTPTQIPEMILLRTRSSVWVGVCVCVLEDDTCAKCELLLITVNYTRRNIMDGDPKIRCRLGAVRCVYPPLIIYSFV